MFKQPLDCSPWNSPSQKTELGSLSLLHGLPNPEIKTRFPALQAYSLPVEPPGKPKNTGMGSLSLLQRISPTQESNCGLLHCRRIPYQLSYAAAAATKSIQSCPTLCDPIDGSHQALSSLGFSRQEHWSGLPFPSPMHESEK